MKTIFVCMLLIPLLMASACSPVPVNNTNNKSVVYAQSELERDTEPLVDPSQVEALVAGNTAFALNFYDEINDVDGNLIFSPFSLSLALSMTLAGAEADTWAEMLDALSLQAFGDEGHPAFNALLLAIEASQAELHDESEGDTFQLNIANSTWGQSGFDFNQAFLDTLALQYGAGIYTVDFKNEPEVARQAINAWVADETEEKIPDLIPQGAIDTLTRLVLANAIYFNGSWLYPFEENDTTPAPFTLLDGSQTDVEMMHLPEERLGYMRQDNFQVVRLPYLSQDFSMILFVPDEGAFEAVENALSSEELSGILDGMRSVPVDLKMPKFNFESSVSAPNPLKRLGMLSAFDPDLADFSGINAEQDLFISDVVHEATITVDEHGTEAAAATAVIMSLTSAPIDEPISLVIDRPFIFAIQHQPSGTILFLGRVVQP